MTKIKINEKQKSIIENEINEFNLLNTKLIEKEKNIINLCNILSEECIEKIKNITIINDELIIE